MKYFILISYNSKNVTIDTLCMYIIIKGKLNVRKPLYNTILVSNILHSRYTCCIIEFLKRYYYYTLCICTRDDGFRLTCCPAPGTEANVYPSPTRPLAWRIAIWRGWRDGGGFYGKGIVGGCGCPRGEIGLTSCMSGRPDLATKTTRATETPTKTPTRTTARTKSRVLQNLRTGKSISKVVVFVIITVITTNKYG